MPSGVLYATQSMPEAKAEVSVLTDLEKTGHILSFRTAVLKPMLVPDIQDCSTFHSPKTVSTTRIAILFYNFAKKCVYTRAYVGLHCL